SSGQGCVFYAFLLRRQEVFTIFFRLSLKGLKSLFSSTLSRLSRCHCAVSVGAHYREPKLLCKGFLKEKRSLAELLGKNDLFQSSWLFYNQI
ncbi:hypothetical protein, partial [Shewanella indica]|uniref:hypothetical protein n=1 Tax=Shewanella indica TaxID=768528 RepID=UPI00399C034B